MGWYKPSSTGKATVVFIQFLSTQSKPKLTSLVHRETEHRLTSSIQRSDAHSGKFVFPPIMYDS